jgi:proline iminopeptidase
MSVMEPARQLAIARLVTHYWGNGCFLDDGQLLRDAGRLAGIPGVMVHGRLDVSGPLDVAWRMHQAWPDSELVVLADAGHGGGSMSAAVVAATDRFAAQLT